MGVKLTIGMASYNNAEQVWWTVQALRLYHDLTDCELLVVDNFGNEKLKNWCNSNGVRYEIYNEIQGTAAPRNKVFELADSEFVLCIDSHVMLAPGSIDSLNGWIDRNKDSTDLIHGPLVYDHMSGYVDSMKPEWKCNFYGVWAVEKKELPSEPYEIQMHGLGLFGCFKDKWLGFNKEFRGFGGEECYIHEKYRKYGHKVICLPFLKWMHRFHDQLSPTPYHNSLEDRARNYTIGWTELGLDISEIKAAFPNLDITLDKISAK